MTDTIRITDPATRFTIVSNDAIRAPYMSRDARLTYATLLSYAWQDKSCFPGLKRLAEDLDANPRSIIRWINELEYAGWIVRHQRRQENLTTVYELHGPTHVTAASHGLVTAASHGHVTPASHEEDSVHKDASYKDSLEIRTSVPSDLSDRTGPDEPTQVLETLGAKPDPLALQLAAKTIADHPSLDPVDVAIEFARYRQRTKGSRPIDRDPVKGWVNAMRSADRKGLYQRTTTPAYEPAEPAATGIPAFDELVERLHVELLPGDFDTWIRPLKPVSCSRGSLTVEAPDPYHQDWIQARFSTRIADALAHTGHPELTITYVTPQEAPA